MKALVELANDISTPSWVVDKDSILSRDGEPVVMDPEAKAEDLRLMAAAPKLYHGLYEAVYAKCNLCCNYDRREKCCRLKPGSCFVQSWRAYLSEAAGEEE